jgi:hypothetical protein
MGWLGASASARSYSSAALTSFLEAFLPSAVGGGAAMPNSRTSSCLGPQAAPRASERGEIT